MASLTTGALLVFIVPALPAAALTPTGSSTQQTLINQERAGRGLGRPAWSACLAAIAEQNAQRMVRQGYISHTNGPQLDLACGIGATRSAGENVAYLSSGIDDATANTMFMNSPGHRANIMGAYGWVGTAWAVAPNGYGYVAVEFLGASAAVLPDGFHPLTPTRILDTRTGAGGVPIAPVGGGGILNVQVAGRGGVPASGVSAVVLNLTATNTTASSFVTAYPAGVLRPNASNLNFVAGQTVPNRAIVKLGTGGQISLFNLTGNVDLVADVGGWFSDGSVPSVGTNVFIGVTPARVLDTRDGTGGFATPLGQGAISLM